jgi:hypothetical protein
MSHTATLDDFEQSFHQFTIAIEESIESLLGILDREEVPAPVADKLMNILIGMSGYVDARSTDLSDDLEHHIKKHLVPGYKWRGYLKMGEDGTIIFPPDLLNELGWKPGDILQYSLNHDKSVRIEKFPMQQS